MSLNDVWDFHICRNALAPRDRHFSMVHSRRHGFTFEVLDSAPAIRGVLGTRKKFADVPGDAHRRKLSRSYPSTWQANQKRPAFNGAVNCRLLATLLQRSDTSSDAPFEQRGR
jgi:hypothetical protein